MRESRWPRSKLVALRVREPSQYDGPSGAAGRKTPLTREVRPVITEDAAQAAPEDLIADNIKKGWELRE